MKHKLSQSHLGVSSLLLIDSTSFFFLSLHTLVCVATWECTCAQVMHSCFSVKKCVGTYRVCTCVCPCLPVEGWQQVSSSNCFPPYSLSPEFINWASLLNQLAPVIPSLNYRQPACICTLWGSEAALSTLSRVFCFIYLFSCLGLCLLVGWMVGWLGFCLFVWLDFGLLCSGLVWGQGVMHSRLVWKSLCI